jgi:hypothetical protein
MAIREANALRGSADVLVAVAFGYFVICFSLSQVGRHFERRTARELQPSTATAQPTTAPALAMARRPTKNASGAVTAAMDGREAL